MPTRKEKQRAASIFARLAASIPAPTTELRYASGFQLLVAVILSAQSTDKQVNIVTKELFQAAADAQSMAELGESQIREYIKSLGLFNNKARNLAATSAIVAEQYQGKVPQERELLEQLPGVGRKTANVILNTLYQQPVIAVDTHIFRVANRLKLTQARNVKQSESQLMAITPSQYLVNAHHWLILHGRYCCSARQPQCHHCVLQDLCPSASIAAE